MYGMVAFKYQNDSLVRPHLTLPSRHMHTSSCSWHDSPFGSSALPCGSFNPMTATRQNHPKPFHNQKVENPHYLGQ
jgi:hypothetical protein